MTSYYNLLVWFSLDQVYIELKLKNLNWIQTFFSPSLSLAKDIQHQQPASTASSSQELYMTHVAPGSVPGDSEKVWIYLNTDLLYTWLAIPSYTFELMFRYFNIIFCVNSIVTIMVYGDKWQWNSYVKLCEGYFECLYHFTITVESPITDPPRSGQPLYSRQRLCYGLKLL